MLFYFFITNINQPADVNRCRRNLKTLSNKEFLLHCQDTWRKTTEPKLSGPTGDMSVRVRVGQAEADGDRADLSQQ